MFIVPISNAIQPVESLFDNNNAAAAVSDSVDNPQFSDVFKEVFSDVQETQRVVLARGEIDDLHTIYNNMTKAAVAVETFVAIKDAAVNAYDKVLQITM